MAKEVFDSKKFIEIVLIRDIGNILNAGFDYLTFPLIAQGIEVLGGFFDNKSFNANGVSQKRFKKGIQKLFGMEYRRRAKWLYKNLRCSLTHQLTPSKLSLTSFQSNAIKEVHFKKIQGRTFLVADVLYADFKIACESLIAKLENPRNREIPKEKKKASRLVIHKTKYIVTGGTEHV